MTCSTQSSHRRDPLSFGRVGLLLAALMATALLLAACPAAAPAPATAPTDTALPAPANPPAPTEAPAAPPTNTPAPQAVDTPAAEAQPGEAASAAQPRTFVVLPAQTSAQYSIDEIFINQSNRLNTAVGVTSQVTGSLTLDYANPSASQLGEFVVDISTLKSDSSRRDGAIRDRWIETARYPLVTFAAKEIRDFPAGAKEGEPVQFKIAGDMLIRETTREQVWDVTATLNGDTLSGTATTFLMLADYNVPVPDMLGILKVTDGLTATLNFVLQAQD